MTLMADVYPTGSEAFGVGPLSPAVLRTLAIAYGVIVLAAVSGVTAAWMTWRWDGAGHRTGRHRRRRPKKPNSSRQRDTHE